MEELLRSKIADIAADYTDKINQLIQNNAEWYKKTDTTLEIKFGKNIEKTIERAVPLHSGYDNSSNLKKFDEDLDQFRISLKIASATTGKLVSTYTNARDEQVSKGFESIINNCINSLDAELKVLPNIDLASSTNITEVATATNSADAEVQNKSEDEIEETEAYWIFGMHDIADETPTPTHIDFEFNAILNEKDFELAKKIKKGDKSIGAITLNLFSPQCIYLIDAIVKSEAEIIIKTVVAQVLINTEPTNKYNHLLEIDSDINSPREKKRKLYRISKGMYDEIVGIPDSPVDDTTQTSSGEYQKLQNYLLSDEYTSIEKDALGFRAYADTIYGLLTEGESKPPLNIAVIAPWGRGKTSLMHMVKKQFDDEREQKFYKESVSGKTHTKAPRLNDLKKWIRLAGDNVKAIFNDTRKIPNATVWFNPWNYQSSEMIWAGLAHAVINQVVDQLPTQVEKEEFWIKLKLARVDKQKLRHELQMRVIYFYLRFIGIGFAAICAILYFFIKDWNGFTVIGTAGAVSSVYSFVLNYLKPNYKKVSETFSSLTQPPNYEQKLGLFHEVNEDIKKVLDILVDENNPPVIFVDDLDRCSPSKVVEVIEAINLFMSGEFNTKCYFVIGMDAEIVAAALDVAYEKMKGQIKRHETIQGSIGWYFLDKFIQLPFFIPVLDKIKKEAYLKNILNANSSEKNMPNEVSGSKQKLSESEKLLAADRLKTELDNETNAETRKKITLAESPEVLAEYDKKIVVEQIKSTKDDPKIKEQVSLYAEFLGSDPRSLKRFANLLRFYSSYQFLRMTKGETNVQIKTLAKWLALMLRFPQMVRWVQVEDDAGQSNQLSSANKAAIIDGFTKKVCKKGDWEIEYNSWLKQDAAILIPALPDNKTLIKNLDESHWLKSKIFFQIIHKDFEDDALLTNALNCNVW